MYTNMIVISTWKRKNNWSCDYIIFLLATWVYFAIKLARATKDQVCLAWQWLTGLELESELILHMQQYYSTTSQHYMHYVCTSSLYLKSLRQYVFAM